MLIAKRGLSHIEVMISFVLFLSFVGFILFFFNPFTNSRLADSSLSYLENKFANDFSAELRQISIKISDYYGDEEIPILIPDIPSEMNVGVESKEGRVLPSIRDTLSGMVYLDRQGENFVILLFSEDLTPYSPPPGQTAPFSEENYTIASTINKKVLSERKILELNESYYREYNGLREMLSLPGSVDFDFALLLRNNEIVGERKLPQGQEVFSSFKREEVLLQNGEREFADLIVRVW